jgi:hypothetical protein
VLKYSGKQPDKLIKAMKKRPVNLFYYYRLVFGYFYRGLKKVVRKASAHHIYTGCLIEGLNIWNALSAQKQRKSSENQLRQYKNKWSRVSTNVPGLFLHLYPSFSGVDSGDYVPDNLFFTHVEPMLNNVEYSRSFADKNMYGLLVEKSILPEVLLRKMHGAWYDADYNMVAGVNQVIRKIAGRYKKVIIKNAVSSQGGDNILLVQSDGEKLYSKNALVDKNWLEKNFYDNFLVQAFVFQHPFYEKFNVSSLNTFRIYTYRSVSDDSVHVLQSMLRVGGKGSVVDNISKGGKACGIDVDGTLNGTACDIKGHFFDRVGEIDIRKGFKLFKYKEVADKAKELARKQFYTRVIGFDFCVARNGEVKLIELNNYDVGVGILQMCNGPLFKEFTDEVIDYCQKQKKNFRYIIR